MTCYFKVVKLNLKCLRIFLKMNKNYVFIRYMPERQAGR